MAGFEREVKSRILGFTPHLVVRSVSGGMLSQMTNWDEVSEKTNSAEDVTESYAFVKDNTILDFRSFQAPVFFRAVDTQNEEQVTALEQLIDTGTAEMGLDEKVVMSEGTAANFGVNVGDVIQLYSTRNFREVFRAYKITEKPSAAVEFVELFSTLVSRMREARKLEEGKEGYDFEVLRGIYDQLGEVARSAIRPGEVEILEEVQQLLLDGETKEGRKILPAGSADRVESLLKSLGELDMEREDSRVLKDIRDIVLPKDMEVVGIYKATRHVAHPDIFVPLPTGQELKGLFDGVDGLGVWTKDAYAAEKVGKELQELLGTDYHVETWMSQYKDWFELIARERIMMYFSLSFIILVSAFCICGIMFTVTFLKKQEIGVMKALGARPFQIVGVFLYQGMVIGFFGSGLGVILGLLVIHFRQQIHGFLQTVIGFDPFPAAVHGISFIPAHVNPTEVLSIFLGAFVLCSLAGLIPALVAAWRDAARSLRNF